jgi:hypothetical protein
MFVTPATAISPAGVSVQRYDWLERLVSAAVQVPIGAKGARARDLTDREPAAVRQTVTR